jgi:hypothetical protein
VSRRRGRARERTWWPPAAPPAPAREVVAGAAGKRPSWPRTAHPSIGQSAATAARLGQGLPLLAVEDPTPTLEPEPEPAGSLGASCGGPHPTPGGDRPPWARPIGGRVEDSPAMLRDRGASPPGWGRNRGGCW